MKRPEKDAVLAEIIRQQQAKCFHTYGYRRMWQWLKGSKEICHNPKTILRVMKKYDLLAEIRRRRKWQQMSQHVHKYQNLLNRNFQAAAPNCKWVTDISYIQTKQGVLYLSMIRDLYDNSIVAYKTATQQTVNLVLDALNVGMLMMGRRTDVDVDAAILEFVTKYGLLGLMTALPTTPSFMDYEAVYLPKNHFIKAETMETEDYLALFYPFEQLDVVKQGVESDWTVSGDRTMIALTMTFADEPMAKTMSFQREYAEPYDWIAQQLKDWAFTLTTSVLYYHDYDSIDEGTRNLYRKAMAAFGGIAPSYHIELLEKPTIYWDFHSLLLGIQMMFSFMLVDEARPLRLCKHCQKVFMSSRANAAFCSARCKNQYNVYKSRGKHKEQDGDENA
ncbi:hypothetical protein B5F98_12465 [Pseudoflavonifractor sp. An44]|uniref:IS3 family transposase n=1 Tax=Pseudoflavonifractor sp. An44 TaxID=1965635 RepID=UPI000B397C7B|nr:IS3 family transposase [Pseudoflavonifractor sp. An44]OUN90628.1 hypothetical protein B5F98_12465 [Pseudoflavonifractor sp. An44]